MNKGRVDRGFCELQMELPINALHFSLRTGSQRGRKKNSASESERRDSASEARLVPLALDHDTRLSHPKPNREPVRRLAVFLVCKPFQLQNGTHSDEVLMISESRA